MSPDDLLQRIAQTFKRGKIQKFKLRELAQAFRPMRMD